MGDRRENFGANRQDRMDRRRDHGQNIRNEVRGRHNNLFTPNWRTGHAHLAHGRYHWWGRHPGHYWWRRATWAAVGAWLPWRWASSNYYDYGGNVYYYDDTVYVDGNETCSAEQYAEQAIEIAASAPAVEEEQMEWMPLGVFALTHEERGDPDMFLQLTVSKEGIIAGTYTNVITDTAQPVEGMVDQKTQRAVWTIGDKKDTTLETGIYNLTQDQTTILVHFGGEKTQQWFMTRLEEPETAEPLTPSN